MTDQFIQPEIAVYVINLDRSADRLAHMTAQLDSIGLEFERIPAVEGAHLQLDGNCGDEFSIDFDYWRKYHHRNVTASEIGCYLSHIKALETFLASSLSFALILEDDAEIAPDLVEVLHAIAVRAAEWDLVKLCASHPGIQISRAP